MPVPEQNIEFVAANASDRVPWPHGLPEPGCNSGQKEIAGAVAEGIVDFLEMIQIDEEEREFLAEFPRFAKSDGQAIFKERRLASPVRASWWA